MDLLTDLQSFDGKQVSTLIDIASRMQCDAEEVNQLIALLEHEELRIQVGASWLLKKAIEDGVENGLCLTKRQSRDILLQLMETTKTHHSEQEHAAWEVQLHLLQMVDKLAISKSISQKLHGALFSLTTHPNKFVKAWAYNGLGVLAMQYPSYLPEVISLFDSVYEQESASVKARIRKCRKGMDA